MSEKPPSTKRLSLVDLLAIIAGERLKLVSRKEHDRTPPFRALAEAGLPAMVLDGEIAVPDDPGGTRIDALSEAISSYRQEKLAYYLLRPAAARCHAAARSRAASCSYAT